MSDKKLSFSQNSAYNTIGILINNFCLWLTTLAVVRLSPDYANAGVWQLSISVINIFSTLAAFNLMQYYVSDVNNEHQLEDYLGTQLITCISASLICVAYSTICGYRGAQFFCICAYMLVRVIEVIAGFMFGIDQRNYRMDFVGISYALRGILELVLFSLVLYTTKNIVFAVLSMAIAALTLLVFYDIPNAKRFGKISVSISGEKVKSIVLKCTRSVLAILIFIAVSTIPRQFLEKMYNSEAIGYYSTIAAPIVVIQVIVINVFLPLLRDVAEYYKNGNFEKLKTIALKIIATLIGLAVLGNLGAVVLGKPVYGLLYGQGIRDYCYLIYAVIGCVILYAACWACWTTLIAIRKTNLMIWFSAISLLTVIVFGRPMINHFGLNGVSFVTIIAYGIYLVLSVFFILYNVKKQKESFNGTGD